MVIAWIGFASVAIFMARYMRGAFDEKKLLGTKIWFTVRRAGRDLFYVSDYQAKNSQTNEFLSKYIYACEHRLFCDDRSTL